MSESMAGNGTTGGTGNGMTGGTGTVTGRVVLDVDTFDAGFKLHAATMLLPMALVHRVGKH